MRLGNKVTYRKIALIYNPYAGGLRGRRASRLLDAEEGLRKYGAVVDAIPTNGPRNAGTLAARAIDNGADLIVVAGGDGTINEAAEGISGTEIPLGILPAGTANVLACELGVRGNLRRAAEDLLSYPAERISTGRVYSRDEDPRTFLLMAGAGLDAYIVYSLSVNLKRRFGKFAYWLAGFRQFGRRFAEFSVRANGREYRSSFALISKVRNYGGDLEIAPSVSLLDDEFEVVLFQGSQSWRYIAYLAAVAAKLHMKMRGVTIFRATELELRRSGDDRVFMQVDGEFAGHLPARVEIVPASLTLLIPPRYLEAARTADRNAASAAHR